MKNTNQKTENEKAETDPGRFSLPVFCLRFTVSGSFLFGSRFSGLGRLLLGVLVVFCVLAFGPVGFPHSRWSC
jgi:hypothetical protein